MSAFWAPEGAADTKTQPLHFRGGFTTWLASDFWTQQAGLSQGINKLQLVVTPAAQGVDVPSGMVLYSLWLVPERRSHCSADNVLSCDRSLFFAGLHHDPLSEALLERREAVLPQHQQPKHDLRWQAGEEDLGPGHVLCPLQALLHPWHHHGQCHAAGPARWEGTL